MTHTPANDNRQRPAEFDAKVMDHLPVIKGLARKMVPAAERADFVQDVLAYVFAHWTAFRGDDYGQGSGFYTWLTWQVRAVFSARNHRVKTAPHMAPIEEMFTLATEPTQERALIAKDMLSRIPRSRSGRVLLRRGMGEKLCDLGKRMRVTTTRVAQLEAKARASFVKKVAA